jgi:preprotein translocase SecE subunit
VAKSRAQRKAEAAKRRQREEELRAEGKLGVESDVEAQHDTQVPESADVLEAEIAIEQGAELAERQAEREAPAPSRADVGRPEEAEGEPTLSRRERRRQERERAQRAKAQMERRSAKPAAPERQRGPVISFFQSVWRELQKVQWPDRDTLVQASAVTLLFVAVAAAYLGALDAVFSRLVDLFIT